MAYGPASVSIAKTRNGQKNIDKLIWSVIKRREIQIEKSWRDRGVPRNKLWKRPDCTHEEVKKIRFRINKGKDGWGSIFVFNLAQYDLECRIAIKSNSVGTGKERHKIRLSET